MAQIICRDLAIGYEGKTVVQNINLSVKKGDYLCVIGENGAGKSTFMNYGSCRASAHRLGTHR